MILNLGLYHYWRGVSLVAGCVALVARGVALVAGGVALVARGVVFVARGVVQVYCCQGRNARLYMCHHCRPFIPFSTPLLLNCIIWSHLLFQ